MSWATGIGWLGTAILLAPLLSPVCMLKYFTTNSTSTPVEQPTLAPTTMASTSNSNSEDDSALSSPPPPHIIHSPLPSRPSPTQPAHVLDALVRGTHAGSSASPAPTTESSTTSFSAHNHAHNHHHAPNSHSSTPQSFNHLQSAQAQPDRGIDLLAMLTNAANASQSQLSQFQSPQLPQITQPPLQPYQSHPQPPRMPVDDPKIAGRMILDSLIKYVHFSLSRSPPYACRWSLCRCVAVSLVVVAYSRDAVHAFVQLFAAALASYSTRPTTPEGTSGPAIGNHLCCSSSCSCSCSCSLIPIAGATGTRNISWICNIPSILPMRPCLQPKLVLRSRR